MAGQHTNLIKTWQVACRHSDGVAGSRPQGKIHVIGRVRVDGDLLS